MHYFPAFLRLEGRRCLLVGGGEVAARKARLLLSAGAELTIVAPALGKACSELSTSNGVRSVAREFRTGDVDGHWLVVSATGNRVVDRQVYEAATDAGVFCNAVDDKQNCSYITPAIVDRGRLVVAVSSGGSAPVLARMLRARIESWLPASLGRLAQLADEWRLRVRERIAELPVRRRFWERFFERGIAFGETAGGFTGADDVLEALLDEHETAGEQGGEAWLVGAGPGDPDLLTLRGLQCLQAADVIVHDRLVSPQILALGRRDAGLISVGKRPGCRVNSQESINALLVKLVAGGKRVCRLKGGDPFIFGRGGEEAEALESAGVRYEVVPGITAAAGCAAAAGIPLTHRDAAQSVVLLTAHGKGSVDTLDWPSLARDRQTLAVYMAVRRFPDLMSNLIAHGRAADTPVAIIERGTTDDQRIIRGTLGQLTLLAEAHRVEAPAMLIVGEVAGLGATVASRFAFGGDSRDNAIDTDSAIHKTASCQ